MRKLTTREKVLVGALALVAVVMLRAMSGDGIGFGSPVADEFEPAPPFGEPPDVRTDLLALNTADFDPQGRNLFDYYTPPPPPRPKPKPQKPKPQKPVEVKRERPKPPPPPPPPVAQAPAPKFKYLGFLGPKEGKIAVFDNGTEDLMLAKIGDTVQDEFKLVEFKYDAVLLAYTDERWKDQVTELKFVGQR